MVGVNCVQRDTLQLVVLIQVTHCTAAARGAPSAREGSATTMRRRRPLGPRPLRTPIASHVRWENTLTRPAGLARLRRRAKIALHPRTRTSMASRRANRVHPATPRQPVRADAQHVAQESICHRSRPAAAGALRDNSRTNKERNNAKRAQGESTKSTSARWNAYLARLVIT